MAHSESSPLLPACVYFNAFVFLICFFPQQKHPLESQRPFVYETVTLRDVSQPEPLKPEDPDAISAFLETKVNFLDL